MAEVNEIFPAGEAEKIKQVGIAIADTDTKLISLAMNMEKLAATLTAAGINFKDLQKAQEANVKASKDLDAVGKQLESTETKLVQLKDDRQKGIIQNKEQIADRNKVLKAEATLNKENAGTLEKLAAKNSLLRNELKGLNLETAEGKKRQKEIVAELDKNTAAISANSDKLVKNKMNIGNYASALDGVRIPMGGFSVGMGGVRRAATAVATGLSSATKTTYGFASALISTGIGALIVALGVGIAAFSAALKTNQGLLDKFNQFFGGIKQVIAEVIDRIGKLGFAIVKLFKGEWKEAYALATEATKGFTQAIRDQYNAGAELTAQAQEHRRIMMDYSLQIATNENKIAKLRLATREYGATNAEIISSLKEAIALTQENTRLEQAQILMKIKEELQTTNNAEALEKVNAALASGKAIKLEDIGLTSTMIEGQETLTGLIIDYNRAETAAYTESRRMQSQLTTEMEAQAAEQKKNEQERLKVIEDLLNEEQKAREDAFEAEIEADIARDEAKLAADIAATEQELLLSQQRVAQKEAEEEAGKRLAEATNIAMSESAIAATESAETMAEASSGMLNTLRKEIKARLAQALATQVAKVIAKVPFPFNIAAAAAAGAALNLAFNKLVPAFASGTDNAPGSFVAGEAGRELLHLKSGDLMLADKATHFEGNQFKGAKVYTNKETEQILQGSRGANINIDLSALRSDLKSVKDAIIKKPVLIVDKKHNIIGQGNNSYKKIYLNKLKYGDN